MKLLAKPGDVDMVIVAPEGRKERESLTADQLHLAVRRQLLKQVAYCS